MIVHLSSPKLYSVAILVAIRITSFQYDGRTPLHIAASEGHSLVVEAMLSEGAPVHVRDRHGNTPLIDAVRNK